MNLYKDLGLNDKYSETKKVLKKTKDKIKNKYFRPLRNVLIIAGIIAVIYIINIALGGVFNHSIKYNEIINLPIGKDIQIELDETIDPDTDGITTGDEIKYKTNPFNRDTDGDGVTDDGEIRLDLDPLVYNENILEDAYTRINGTKFDVPVNYGRFEIRNASLHSRAYFSIISEKLPTEENKITIKNFDGEIRDNGTNESKLYLKQPDGLFKQVSKTNIRGEAEFKESSGETVTTLKTFGHIHIIENDFLRSLLKFFLPENGAISAFDNLKTDYSPQTLKYNNQFNESNKEYANEALNNLGDNRFNLLHIDTSYKDRLADRIRLGEVVPASIITENKEYIILITGQYENGDFAVIDASSGKEIGALKLEKVGRPLTDGDNLVQMETLTFSLGELSSENNDRLIFL